MQQETSKNYLMFHPTNTLPKINTHIKFHSTILIQLNSTLQWVAVDGSYFVVSVNTTSIFLVCYHQSPK